MSGLALSPAHDESVHRNAFHADTFRDRPIFCTSSERRSLIGRSGANSARSSAFPSAPTNGARYDIWVRCRTCGVGELMAPRARADREPPLMLWPVQLRVGDRFTDLDGEWEISGGPLTLHGGKTVGARVARPNDPRSVKNMTWAAHEKITVRRPAGRGLQWAERRRALLVVALACLQLVYPARREERSK